MKFQKKKSKELRKLRKQKKRKPQQSFEQWLTPLDKQIHKLADKITSERKYGKELYNKRFKCNDCSKVYCFAFDDTLVYCEDCYARAWCDKQIRGIKSCCKGGLNE